MKKNILLIIAFVVSFNIHADEGMWIPILLNQNGNINRMQQLGCKLSADDIYSINKSSLKDAIVLFGGGCTAEVISEEGLIITNHHCGFSQIQSHSSVEHDYLKDGFWAMNKEEELTNPSLTVSFLIRMEDVTARVLKDVSPKMSEKEREKVVNAAILQIEAEAKKDTKYDASVKPLYYGNEYFLYVMETFKDVRLVGAPPSSIGKFGGDTDNWMWPRHTGDFSIFRIYADKNNNPAPYSKENVPYKPKKALNISLKGTKKGDFTMVYGFPGRTSEYLTSDGVNLSQNIDNPIRIRIRDRKLQIMNEEMALSAKVRIQYANKAAGVANSWKKWIGENRGLKELNTIAKKQELEKRFTEWNQSTPELKDKYGSILNQLKETYTLLSPLTKDFAYYAEAGIGIESIRFARNFKNLLDLCAKGSEEDIKKESERLRTVAKGYFKDYNQQVDKKTFTALMEMYKDGIEEQNRPDIFAMIEKKYLNNFQDLADDTYKNSLFVNETKLDEFLANFTKNKAQKIESDLIFQIMRSITKKFEGIKDTYFNLTDQVDVQMRIYVAGLREMDKNKIFYPDANSTLRVAFGKVDDYYPRDGVFYNYYTTIEGIIEKENPDIYDYAIPAKLKELYKSKDYGKYADSDGKMRVCFTASNHTTGGNSGSPVLDGEGNLIGINFDRDWEGTMSDIMYDPDKCRNITLDVRYALFIIDKLAGANNLINEMKIIF